MAKFDTNWWDEFLETTHQMTKTSVLQKCISKEEISELMVSILEIIFRLSNLRTNEYGYRIFVDNRKLGENEMHYIYDNPPFRNESIEDWCNRVFKGKEFGIIINSAERFSSELSALLAIKSKPLFDKLGFPIEGVNLTFFIGNYSSTPIGIHQDMPGENVIHYHLGPGKKTMLTWDQETYLQLKQKFDDKDIEAFSPHAKKFIFEEGDLYFMPQGVYHVGMQEGFSIAITFWFYNHAKKRIVEKLHTMLLEQYIDEEFDELLSPDLNDLDNSENLNNILEVYTIPKATINLPFSKVLEDTYRDLRYTIASNAGYRHSFLPENIPFELSIKDTVIVENPYKILINESSDSNHLLIYVRGIKISFRNLGTIKKIVSVLNEGKPTPIRKLKLAMDEGWDDHHLLHILSLLLKYKGIKRYI